MSTGKRIHSGRLGGSADLFGRRAACLSGRPTATDLFCGGGGSTLGLERAGYDVLTAINHWPTAILTHRSNHPNTEHQTWNLSADTDFRRIRRTDILWVSPSCVWHARSGGRKQQPVEAELRRADEGSVDRATAFAVIAATEVHRYDAVIVENVPEFQNWVLYEWWLDGMRRLGYREQILILNSADVGPNPVAQHRIRFYGVHPRWWCKSDAGAGRADPGDSDPGSGSRQAGHPTAVCDAAD
ncbi:DNA cytosine methyltransferase [Nocardia sp. NPDC051570]|uniref:DNA cytosine methyltransferase n=1 Tax=Nocardia sp. NPDC051570 TaxID=3364324 RepID=UPI0037B4D9E7